MNFWEHQDQAKAASRRLTLMFALAVIFLAGLFTLVLVIAAHDALVRDTAGLREATSTAALVKIFFAEAQWDLIALIAGGIALVLVSMSLVRVMILKRGGGKRVAESLGGRLVTLDSVANDRERILLNVVTEMALASGIPAPSVYVLEDETINAFAAGNRLEDAVIGVTQGTLTQLNRDQLQGIVAHEFSHIVHGDMSLNLRMIGVLFGIMVFQKIGYQIIRSSGRSKNSMPVVAVGAGFLVCGALGYGIGSLIRAAISRQREFLADASAVQFTRNPQGISEALSKAVGFTTISSPNAGEVAHMFFLQAVKGFFAEPFASHPPIKERIHRIGHIDMKKLAAVESQAGTAPRVAAGGESAGVAAFAGTARVQALKPGAAVASVGTLNEDALIKVRAFVAALPAAISESLKSPDRTAELTLSLAVAGDAATRKTQENVLGRHMTGETVRRVIDLAGMRREGPRLAYLDLAIPMLRKLDAKRLSGLHAALRDLVMADGKVELFEFLLLKNFEKILSGTSGKSSTSMNGGAAALSLITALAYAGARDVAAAQKAFETGMKAMGAAGVKTLPPAGDFTVLANALTAADRLRPTDKKRLLEAAAEVAAADGVLTTDELELLRGVSTYIGCPMPAVA
jgi:Zn-dependent protease with chaperone function/uncharacterized tellurite resistance protein B-like protein